MLPLEDGRSGLGSREADHVQPHAGELDDVVPQLGGVEALLLTELRHGVCLVRGPDVSRYEGRAAVIFRQWDFPRQRLAELVMKNLSVAVTYGYMLDEDSYNSDHAEIFKGRRFHM